MTHASEKATLLRVKLYQWCLANAQEELARDFPWLRLLRSSHAADYISFLKALPPETRPVAATALVKRFHPSAMTALGDEFSSMDKKLIDAFVNQREILTNRGHGIAATPGLAKAVERRSLIDKTLLKTEVITRLRKVCGNEKVLRGRCWRYRADFDEMRVDTLVDLGGRIPLKYFQAVTLTSGEEIYPCLSLLQWYGIAAQTSWNLMSPEDVVSSADLLEKACNHFLIEMKEL